MFHKRGIKIGRLGTKWKIQFLPCWSTALQGKPRFFHFICSFSPTCSASTLFKELVQQVAYPFFLPPSRFPGPCYPYHGSLHGRAIVHGGWQWRGRNIDSHLHHHLLWPPVTLCYPLLFKDHCASLLDDTIAHHCQAFWIWRAETSAPFNEISLRVPKFPV